MAQDRLRGNREIGRRGWQFEVSGGVCGQWGIHLSQPGPMGSVSAVWKITLRFNPTRVEFPAACGVNEIGNSIPDTPLLAAGSFI